MKLEQLLEIGFTLIEDERLFKILSIDRNQKTYIFRLVDKYPQHNCMGVKVGDAVAWFSDGKIRTLSQLKRVIQLLSANK